MSAPEFLRLELIEVDGLFGIYDHHIELNLDNRVTLLHGPNGIGKTAVLRMVDAFLRNHLFHFQKIPFSRFFLKFHDGSSIEMKKENGGPNFNDKCELTLIQNTKHLSSKVRLKTQAESIAEQIDYLRPYARRPNTWEDIRDGELLTSSEVVDRYSSEPLDRVHQDKEEISWFNDFLKKANAHLIEAQRLVRLDQETGSRGEYGFRRTRPSSLPTVLEYSQDLKKRLSDTMAQYGRESQNLDQSFPHRVISATEGLPVGELQEKMNSLDQKTKEFKEIGVLDEKPTPPFDATQLEAMDQTQSRVMTLYASDTKKKLAVLDSLATRSRLLLNSVNQKYRNKKIRLDNKEGLVAESDNSIQLALDALSSGEQHELVLHYDLLFKVPPNTIVLIDEPELSLHVAWQKKFLPDLLEIVNISNFDALIATHSPYIIGDKEELMVGLGDST